MFDLRIYRTALLPAVAAFVLIMFSFEPAPSPLPPPVTSPLFDGTTAARAVRAQTAAGAEMTPGSAADRMASALVLDRFSEIPGGVVTEQSVGVPSEGEEVRSRNVILTLPGSTDRTLLVVAPRNAPGEATALQAAAATGTLIELAGYLGDSRHTTTIVLASTAGGDGAAGTRELLEADLGAPIEAAIVVDRPAAPDPEPPFVRTPAGAEGIPPQLVETARDITSTRFQREDQAPGLWQGLAELAFPEGIGAATALHEEGVVALAIGSGAGEDPARGGAGAIDATALSAAGGSVLELVLTLDENGPVEAGPTAHLRLGDNLVPGWAIALFALSLLVAPLLSSIDTWTRSLRADRRTRRTAFWAAERILVPLGALLIVALGGLVGLIPNPAYPFNPALFPPGSTGIVVFLLLTATAVGVALLIRPMRTPLDAEPHTLAAAAGFLTTIGVLGAWALNPWLALLLAPAAHLWIVPARASGPPRPALVALLALLCLAPVAAAFATAGSGLGLNLYEAAWACLLMISDGAVGTLLAVSWCLVLGGLLACISSAGSSAGVGAASAGRDRRRTGMPLAPFRDPTGNRRA